MSAPHGLFTTVDASKKRDTGEEALGSSGNLYIYAKGIGSTAAGSWVAFDSDGTDLTTALLTEAIGVKGVSVGIAMAATIADTYGWYCVKALNGVGVEGLSLINNAADADQFCTTTAATLDDAGTTTVHGIRLIDTATAAGLVTYIVDRPHTNVA